MTFSLVFHIPWGYLKDQDTENYFSLNFLQMCAHKNVHLSRSLITL